MAAPIFMNIIVVFFQAFAGISGGQMPIGIPPKPEMPIMSQVAPDACVFYMSFAGTDTPKADATNQTERLMAEPQVQALIKSIDATIQQAIDNKNDSETGSATYGMAKQLITCPWCVFVSDFKIESFQNPPTFHAGAMVYLGDQQKVFEESLNTILKQAELLDEIPTVTIDGKKFNQLPIGPKISITWAIHDQTLYVGIGDGTIEAMFERLKTSAPKWLVKLKKQLPIERRATITYVNLAKIRETLLSAFMDEAPARISDRIPAVLKAIGLTNLKTFKASTGLDEQGMVELMNLEADGPLEGLIASVVASSLNMDDLSHVPADSNILGAVKINPAKVYEAIGNIADSGEPGTSQILERQVRQLSMAAGFDTFKELLETIGETWVIYNSPSEGGPLLTGLTLSVEVNDTFVQTRAALETILSILAEEDKDAPTIEKIKCNGTEITYLKFQCGPVPVAPAWCIKDGRLILSLVPQNLRVILNRDASSFKPITEIPEIAQALKKSPAPTSLSYADPKSLVETAYPAIPYAVQALASVMKSEGKVDFDAFSVPELPIILPYAKPMIRTLRNTGSGIKFESRSTLPGITTTSGALPVVVAVMLPAVHASRTAARRMHSSNNMKQLLLAMHNYVAIKGNLPPAYTVDKKGKPLLSWRVYMLPYLEESELYEEFKLDEPWDSKHNKKLIARMPATFKSPMSKAGPGKTTYLTVRTKGSAFPGKEKIGFRNITDGTSNTIAMVEVNDKNAVTWTKPDDFVPDKKDPTKGLTGVYPGIFLVGLCDGSVRFITGETDKDILRALFTRNGKEAIDYSGF